MAGSQAGRLPAKHQPPANSPPLPPPLPLPVQLLQDVRAVRASCCSTFDGQLDLGLLVTHLQGLGYACYVKRNNPGARLWRNIGGCASFRDCLPACLHAACLHASSTGAPGDQPASQSAS